MWFQMYNHPLLSDPGGGKNQKKAQGSTSKIELVCKLVHLPIRVFIEMLKPDLNLCVGEIYNCYLFPRF